jgi:hypothetical protein|tara:strand:- start:3882 stop:6302 length:2421 start_codon:yes stop_codon:yes gene_type:complete
MNLKMTRIAVGGAKNAVGHIHKTDENESVRVLEGDVNDILVDAELDARALGRSKSVRHIVISPDEELTDEQRNEAIQMIRDEFGMGDRPIYLVEHVKARADGKKIPHFHGLLSETHGAGNQIEHAHFMRRNEKLARKMELRFGHNLTKGRHNKAVLNALKKEGATVEAAAIQHLTEGGPALSKYGNKSHQKAKRLGYSLPKISQALTELQKGTAADIAAGLDRICEEHGITVQKSDRRSAILIVAEDGTVLKNANRSLKIKANQVDEILANVRKDTIDDRPTNTGRTEGHDGGQLSGTIEFTGGTDTTGASADVIRDIPEPDIRGASNNLESDIADQTGHDADIGIGAAERGRGRGPDAGVTDGYPRANDRDGENAAPAQHRVGRDQEQTATSNTGRDTAGDATLTAVHKINRKRAASELAPALAKAKQAVSGDKEPAQLTARHIIERRRTAENMKPKLEAAKAAIEGPKAPTVQQKVQRNHAAQGVQDQLAAAKAAIVGDTTPAPVQVTPLQAITRSRIARILASALAAAKRAVFGDPQPTFQQKLQRAATASALAPQLEAAKKSIFKEQIDAIKNEEETNIREAEASTASATRSQEDASREAEDIELIDDEDDFKAIARSPDPACDPAVWRQHNADVLGNHADIGHESRLGESRGADQRDERDVAVDPGSSGRGADRRERQVQEDVRSVAATAKDQSSSSGSNAAGSGRTESQPTLSKTGLAALGHRHMANKAASGVRASKRSLDQTTKRMKNRHKGDMNLCAAQAMMHERSGGSPTFATLDGDDFQALIAFFQQNQATLRNTL